MKFSNLITLKYGKSQKKVESKLGYPIFGTGGIIGYADTYLYNKETILFGRKGSISKVQFIREPFWCVDTTFYSIINEDIVIPKYLYYKLSTIDFNINNEGTTIPSLRADTLNEIDIDIHDKSTQQHIVDTIGSIDDLIENNNNILLKLESLLIKEYEKSINLNSTEYKLKEILHVIDNRGKTPKTTNNKSLHPIIEVAQIANSSMWIDTNACLKFVDDITYNSFFRNGHLKENDVLISTVGTIGVAGFNFIDGLSIAQNVVALRSEYSYLIYCYLILNKEMIINLEQQRFVLLINHQ